MSTLLEEFKSITQALNDAGIDYAICGGWAMAIHGLPRATIDIDLLILGDDLERVWELAKQKGYEVESLPLHFGAIGHWTSYSLPPSFREAGRAGNAWIGTRARLGLYRDRG